MVTAILFGFLMGLLFFNLFIHLQISTRMRTDKREIAFTVCVFSAMVYVLFTYLEYLTPDIQTYFLYVRIQAFATASLLISLIIFIRYIGVDRRRVVILTYVSIMVVFTFLRLVLPNSGVYSSVEGMRSLSLPWGETINLISATPNFLSIVQGLLVVGFPITFGLITMILRYKRRHEKSMISIIIGISILTAAIIFDYAVSLFEIKFLYLSETGFTGMTFIMSFRLTDEVIRVSRLKNDLEITLNEKNALLQEIHHRVKNNLNILISLINLQIDRSHNEETRDQLTSTINRLFSIAHVHEMLYGSDNAARINLNRYLREITMNLEAMYKNSDVKFEHPREDDIIYIPIYLAIPIGLIVNEIMTNSYKHAFRDQPVPKIYYSIAKYGSGKITLVIGDNGCGSAANRETRGLGTELISILCRQIDAEVLVTMNTGRKYTITFDRETKDES